MESNSEYSHLWRVHRTVQQMLRDRKYLVADELYDLEYADFVKRFESVDIASGNKHIRRKDLTVRSVLQHDDSDIIFAFFCEDKKVGVNTVSDFMRKLKADGARRAILIVRQDVTPFVRKVVESTAPHFIIQLFREVELLINVTRHVLVPKHELLDEVQKTELLEKYRLRDSQLSRLLKDDPVARYYGLEKGNVVKIIRASETAGRYVTYRIVV